MHALSVVGPAASEVVAALAERLDGRVAIVERDTVRDAPDVADAHYALDDTGRWVGGGTDRSFEDLLDSLSADHDYTLVAGFSRLRLPTVVLGDGEDVAGDVVREAPNAAALDVAALAAAVDDFEPLVTLEELLDRATASPKAERSGAIATFTGRVRAKDSADDDRTSHLKFEKYEGVAEDRMDRISAELTEREGVFEVLMHHRTGVVVDGEDIVFVVVLAGHRTEAFRAVEDGIDRLKEEVPIFKKETTDAEEFWVHQRE